MLTKFWVSRRFQPTIYTVFHKESESEVQNIQILQKIIKTTISIFMLFYVQTRSGNYTPLKLFKSVCARHVTPTSTVSRQTSYPRRPFVRRLHHSSRPQKGIDRQTDRAPRRACIEPDEALYTCLYLFHPPDRLKTCFKPKT